MGETAYVQGMQLTIESDQEEDGRWLAEIPELPGVMAYGETRELAKDAVRSLAYRVIASKIKHGEARRG